MLFWTPHFSVLNSTFFVLDSTFRLDSTLKIDPVRNSNRIFHGGQTIDERNYFAGSTMHSRPIFFVTRILTLDPFIVANHLVIDFGISVWL